MQEQRKFTVHPAVIYQVIFAQAGTLSKAVTECAMNSVDAGATELSITIDSEHIQIADNGKGFQSKSEIEQWFEVFGFPHEEGDRVYGQFGMGRGQLWAFAKTTWFTNEFVMDVDIKNKGLDYELTTSGTPYKGVLIKGTFYEKMSNTELEIFKRELTELCKYLQIPVTLNGKPLTCDVKAEKWTHETDEAYILLKPTSREMAVYNLGVLVRKYNSYALGGVGGIVVTKPGVRLMVNMARNDILLAKCPVWKKIKPFIVQEAEKSRPANKRLSEDEMESIALSLASGEYDRKSVAELKLVTTVTGRSMSILDFMETYPREYNYLVTVAPKSHQVSVKVHERKMGFVLADLVLARFGVSTIAELFAIFESAIAQYVMQKQESDPWASSKFENPGYSMLGYECLAPKDILSSTPYLKSEMHLKAIREARIVGITDDYLWVGRSIRESHELVKPKNDKERLCCSAAGSISSAALAVVGNYLEERIAYRQVFIGQSETAVGWTDGATWVAYADKRVFALASGFEHWLSLLNVAIHEYLHNEADLDSHMHDEVFMERFHNCVTSHHYTKAVSRLMAAYSNFIRQANLKGIKLSVEVLRDADKLGIDASKPVEEELDTETFCVDQAT